MLAPAIEGCNYIIFLPHCLIPILSIKFPHPIATARLYGKPSARSLSVFNIQYNMSIIHMPKEQARPWLSFRESYHRRYPGGPFSPFARSTTRW